MAACECCWAAAYSIAMSRRISQVDAYYIALREHEERGCPCRKQESEFALDKHAAQGG